MILVTTSRKPSTRTRRFARELSSVLPLSRYLPRGKSSIHDLLERAEEMGMHRVVVIGETKGNPSIMRVLRRDGGWSWLFQIYIRSVSLYVDMGRKMVRIDAEGLSIDADVYSRELSEAFGVYEETDDAVILREREGNVRFLYYGEEVGPRFRIVGVDPVPSALRL